MTIAGLRGGQRGCCNTECTYGIVVEGVTDHARFHELCEIVLTLLAMADPVTLSVPKAGVK